MEATSIALCCYKLKFASQNTNLLFHIYNHLKQDSDWWLELFSLSKSQYRQFLLLFSYSQRFLYKDSPENPAYPLL